MDVGSKIRAGARSSVVAGSVWESRMKLDEVRGGIKVFNGEESSVSEEGNGNGNGNGNGITKSRRGQSSGVGNGGTGKRKTWKSESSDGNPIQIARGKVEENVKEVRSPIQGRKYGLRSEGNNKEILGKSPIGLRKSRSESLKEEPNSAPLRKAKSVSVSAPVQSGKDDGVVVVDDDESGNGIGLMKVKSEPNEALEESIDVTVEEIEKNPIESEKSGSDEGCKELDVCEEKVISSNVEVVKPVPKCDDDDDDDNADDDDDGNEDGEGEGEGEEVNEEIEVEVEVEKKSLDIKEIKKPEPKPINKVVNGEKVEKSLDIKEIKKPEPKPITKVVNGEKVVNEVKKAHFERREVKRLHQVYQKQPEPISLNVKKQPPVIKRATVHSSFAKGSSRSSSFAASDEYHSFPETHSRLQSFVDLIMWKDISRSVFIFGIGTFIIISSSYTKDLNISFISVISYLGLVYLAAIFLSRSIVYRGVIDLNNTSYVLGEEESIWLLKLVLPYLNEFLLKLKALFSGDPSTTMKLAVLLFVLARCGSSITIWTMAKLGFFGVFTVPKVCSLYSAQITAYAKFWGRRFRDAWDSCSHKKAVTVAVFLLVWNLSSIVARIWAVFMLFVAFRYYQQTIVIDDWVVDGAEDEETWHEPIGGQREVHEASIVDNNKQKKRS